MIVDMYSSGQNFVGHPALPTFHTASIEGWCGGGMSGSRGGGGTGIDSLKGIYTALKEVLLPGLRHLCDSSANQDGKEGGRGEGGR